MYVSEMMRKSSSNLGQNHQKKKVSFPQSSDMTAPYILACNYADASPKIVISFSFYLLVILLILFNI